MYESTFVHVSVSAPVHVAHPRGCSALSNLLCRLGQPRFTRLAIADMSLGGL